MKNLHGFVVFYIICTTCINKSDAALTLQQTVPPEGASVCPLSTIQFTCVDKTLTKWTELGSSATTVFSIVPPVSKVGDTSMAGAFTTELTDISGDTLTSTATIDSVSLEDNGKRIYCQSFSNVTYKNVHLEEPPAAPSNLAVNAQSSTTAILSWTVDNSHCVVGYQVEVNSEIIVTNSALQQITLTLQSDETYSLRVRGADAANRIGEWSGSYTHNAANPCGGQAGLTGAVIAGIVIVLLVGVI